MGTALDRAQAETDLALRASQLRHARLAGGRDGRARRRAGGAARRGGGPRGGGPHFLELRTYRFRAHSMYDPERYRDKAEVEQWRQRDPIEALGRTHAAMRASWPTKTWPRSRPTVCRADRPGDRPTARSDPLEPVEEPHPVRLPPGAVMTSADTRARRPTGRPARGASAKRCCGTTACFLMGEDVGRYGGCFAVSLGPARGVRPGADQGHPAVGVGLRRRGHRRGHGRDAANRRDHDGQFQPARARPDHEQRRHAAAHVGRPVSPCRW